jgi:hypothetical protein
VRSTRLLTLIRWPACRGRGRGLREVATAPERDLLALA